MQFARQQQRGAVAPERIARWGGVLAPQACRVSLQGSAAAVQQDT